MKRREIRRIFFPKLIVSNFIDWSVMVENGIIGSCLYISQHNVLGDMQDVCVPLSYTFLPQELKYALNGQVVKSCF